MNKLVPWVVIILLSSNRMVPLLANPVFHILAESSNVPLPGSTLCFGDNDTCLVADSAGFIAIDFLIADSARTAIRAQGFSDTVFAFDSCATDTTTVLMRVIRIDKPYQEIVVVAPRAPRSEVTYRQSLVRITSQDISARAGTADDLSRYIGSLPSAVSSLGEGYDNTFLVRGGRSNETMFLLDGIEMENISHFSQADGSGGPIGFVNTECIDTINYYAGNMPASSPSRLSAVVDIGMKNGLHDTSVTSIGCKLTGGMVGSIGRMAAGKIGYSLSARYVDFTPLRTVIKDEGTPKLGDLFGKLTLVANDRLELSATGIFSYNSYLYRYPVVGAADDGALFNNTMTNDEQLLQGGAGVTLRYRLGPVNSSVIAAVSFRNGDNAELLGSLSDTFYQKRYSANPVGDNRDDREHYTLTTDSRIAIGDHQSASFGLRAARNRSAFANTDQSRDSGTCIYCENDTPVAYSVKKLPTSRATYLESDEAGVFADYTYANGLINAVAGVRADYFQLIDAMPLSPRVSLAIHPARAGTFTGSFGLYHQFPTDMPSMLFDYLSSVPGMTDDSLRKTETTLLSRLQPEQCWQTSIGYDKSLAQGIETRLEAYYKWYDREFNFYGPDFQQILTYGADGTLRFAAQNGKRMARGIEATVERLHVKGLFYSLSGSLFDVKDRYNDGTWYNDWSNVGYTYSLSLGSQFGNGHALAFSIQGSGGRPYCPQIIIADCIKRKIALYDSSTIFYNQRLDPLMTANVRYSFTRRIRGAVFETSIEILNAFNYLPTLEYRFNGDRFVAIKPFSITPILGCRVLF